MGGIPKPISDITQFSEFIQICAFLDFRFKGTNFSWCNGQQSRSRIRARLDCALVNMELLNQFGDSFVRYLSRRTSNHCTMVVGNGEF